MKRRLILLCGLRKRFERTASGSAKQVLIPVALSCLLGSGAIGCSSPAAELHVGSLDHQRNYVQTFNRAYSTNTRDGNGEYDAILLTDGTHRADKTKSTGPLQPGPLDQTSGTPMQQVLHVRVLWQPLKGTKSDAPTATNASLTWIIRESPDATKPEADELIYQGAGFVMVHPDAKGISFSIHDATLNLTTQRGDVADPLGKAIIRGDFYAWRNPSLVQTTLEQLNTEVAK